MSKGVPLHYLKRMDASVFDRWERRIGQPAVEEHEEVFPAVSPGEIPDTVTAGIEGETLPPHTEGISEIAQVARDAVADIQEECDRVLETADQEVEEAADIDEFLDEDGEDDVNEGHEVLESPDTVEPPSDKSAPVEGELNKSTEAAHTPPVETVMVSSSTDTSAEMQGPQVPPAIPLRDDLATHTVHIIQGIVNELKDSFDIAQKTLLKRIKTSENLMLKNIVEINHKLDMMEKKFEEKYTAAGEAVTLLMAGLKKNTDTLAVVNQNAHVVANNIQMFDGNMALGTLGVVLPDNPAGIHVPETSKAVEEVSVAEDVSASAAADIPTHEADARALSKAKLRSMFDQEALAKARGKRKVQEGTSKETPAEKRIRMSEEDVRNERWSPVSRNIILDTFRLQERGEINRNEAYSQYEWETHKAFEAKRNIFFRNNKDPDKVAPPRYYPKPKEYMERQSKKYLAQNLKAVSETVQPEGTSEGPAPTAVVVLDASTARMIVSPIDVLAIDDDDVQMLFSPRVISQPEESEWHEFGNDLYSIPEVHLAQLIAPIVDVSPVDRVDEDSKIKALVDTPAFDWNQPLRRSVYVAGFSDLRQVAYLYEFDIELTNVEIAEPLAATPFFYLVAVDGLRVSLSELPTKEKAMWSECQGRQGLLCAAAYGQIGLLK
ncbi:hypothetical protein KSP40_PGU000555 [Platanthera guangdongensis]|uniref:Uncharacterized protein n=1 Tax=Platanthera guangdongensis TaxID=2320717 RepID=A0ABR2LYS7_9ASPA